MSTSPFKPDDSKPRCATVLTGSKFDFSKLTSREKNVTDERGVTSEVKPEIKVATANASKNNVTDTLLEGLLMGGTGQLRSYASGTNHALLGAGTGHIDLAAAIRSA